MKLKNIKEDTNKNNETFLNNQNYILGKTEKKKLLIKFLIEWIINRTSLFFKKFNKFLSTDNIVILFYLALILLVIFIPLFLIINYTYEWFYLFSLNTDILFITLILTPFLIYSLYRSYFFVLKFKILNKIFFPFFFLFIILFFIYSFVSNFLFNIIKWYLFIKKTPKTKIINKFKNIDKKYAENKYYKIQIK